MRATSQPAQDKTLKVEKTVYFTTLDQPSSYGHAVHDARRKTSPALYLPIMARITLAESHLEMLVEEADDEHSNNHSD